MEIVRLSVKDTDRVVELFTEFCKDNIYYKSAAVNKNMDILSYMKEFVGKQLHDILSSNQTFGVIEKDEIVGYFLCFCIEDLMKISEESYQNTFDGAVTLKGILESYVGRTCFIVSTYVQDNCPTRYLSKLIRVSLEELGYNYNYVTDVIPDANLKELFADLGFKAVCKNGINIWERVYGRIGM